MRKEKKKERSKPSHWHLFPLRLYICNTSQFQLVRACLWYNEAEELTNLPQLVPLFCPENSYI